MTQRIQVKNSYFGAFILLSCVVGGCADSPTKPYGPKIANGRNADASEYPAVVLLQDQTKKSLCSGTFIDANTVLTAAHCTMWAKETDPETNEVKNLTFKIVRVIDIEKKEFASIATSTAVYRHPKWDEAFKKTQINPYDLAIVKFDGFEAPGIAEISSDKPAMGNQVTMVGYGLNYVPNKFAFRIDKSSVGVKRVGENKVALLTNGFISLKGATKTSSADGSNACPSMGDSGGPMFMNGKMVGVTSGGGRFPIILDFAVALYVDLTSDDSQAFLSKFLP